MLFNRKILAKIGTFTAALWALSAIVSCAKPGIGTVMNSVEPTEPLSCSPLSAAEPTLNDSPTLTFAASPTVLMAVTYSPCPTQTVPPSQAPGTSEPTPASQTPFASPTVVTPVPTPAPTAAETPAPTPNAVQSAINHFAIPNAIRGQLSSADMVAYEKIVYAYLNYENSVEFSADSEIHDLKYLLELCFPIFYSDVDEDSIQYGSGRVEWKYKSTEAEHNAVISRFESIILNYLSKLQESDSTVMRCLVLYGELIKSVTYDHTTSDYYDGLNPDYTGKLYDHCCDAFLHGRGICWCFGRSYAYLLNQIGVEALTVCADGGIGHHEWTLLKLDGKWYYADPTWDDPYSVMYFGITANARRSSGYTVENSRYFAGADHPIAGVFDVSDTRFSDIYTGRCYGDYYVLDRKNNKILFYNYGSETACSVFDLN